MDNPVRSTGIYSHSYYPFGNTPMKNLLENVSYHTFQNLKVLLLGCGDIRHILRTSSAVIGMSVRLNFTLGDDDPSIVARNLLLLNSILSDKFSTENLEDVRYLWDVWYNLKWTKQTKSRFLDDVKRLLANGSGCCGKIVTVSEDDLGPVKKVFRFWASYLSEHSTTEHIEEIEKERRNRIMKNLAGKEGALKTTHRFANTFLAMETVDTLGPNLDLLPSKQKFREKLEAELHDFFATGNTGPCSGKFECVNPTLLLPTQENGSRWKVACYGTPFESYCPLPVEKLNSKVKSIASLCQKILANHVEALRTLANEDRLGIHLVLKDAIPFMMQSSDSYDVIDTSSLADKFGLANLLVMALPLMAEGSVLLTETMNAKPSVASVADYFNFTLGTKPEMYPSVFGLRLLRDLAFGSETPCGGMVRVVQEFTWIRTPPYRPRPPLNLNQNDSIRESLLELRKRCFLPAGTQPHYGIECYTPMTLAWVLRSMTLRFDFDLKEALELLKPDSGHFAIAWKAATAWVTGGKLKECKLTCVATPGFLVNHECLPRLILVFFVTVAGKLCPKKLARSRGSYYIDNFSVEIPRTPEVQPTITCSLLLPIEFSFLLQERFLFMYDFAEEQPLSFPVCGGDGIAVQERKGRPLLIASAADCGVPCVVSFNESCTEYEILLDARGSSGIRINARPETPCECVHHVDIFFLQGSVLPLRLTLGWPVLAKDIQHESHGNLFCIRLRKALLQPWPWDVELGFPDLMKDPAAMMNWNSQLDKDCLVKHLDMQFSFNQMEKVENDPVARKNPELELRFKMRVIFTNVQKGNTLFAFYSGSSKKKDLYQAFCIIRTQQNILCSGPQLLPFLAVTFLEQSEGCIPVADINRILHMEGGSWGPSVGELDTVIGIAASSETLRLLHGLLRRNSLRVYQDDQQTANRLKASYLTPLYADQHAASVEARWQYRGLACRKCSHPLCSHCQKPGVDMKRCSRCRAVVYCSVECQKLDWPRHRKVCTTTNS